jgi:Sel1 repeat
MAPTAGSGSLRIGRVEGRAEMRNRINIAFMVCISCLVGCVSFPSAAQYDSQGRRIIKADRQGNISPADQAFIAGLRAQAAAKAPCPSDNAANEAAKRAATDQSPVAFELARNAEAQGNLAAAYQSLFPLSRQGNAEAEYEVGKILESGKVPELRSVAGATAICYRRAAEQGHIKAQTAYGVLLKREFGQPVYSAVLGLFQNAANHGDPEAEYNLGLMYDEGQGVAKNELLAKEWLRKAVAGGNNDAQQRLAFVEQESSGIFSIRDLRAIVGAYNENRPKFARLYQEHSFAFDGFIIGKKEMNDPSQGYFVTFNIGKDPNAVLAPLLLGGAIACISINEEATIDRVNGWIGATSTPRVRVLGTIYDAEPLGLRLSNCTMNRL